VALALEKGPGRILDLATGTGDLALLLKASAPEAEVVGADFAPPMLEIARKKASARGLSVAFQEADALALPFPDGSFDAVTIAFGFRNFADYRKALAELRRVLAPGGRLVILEFPRPPREPLGWSTGSTSSGFCPFWEGSSPGALAPTATCRKAWRPSRPRRP
jgi:demethylmenaquinone methyltransferase/2-methoxy-6-polyprenyl-1,4-benzoquinol methylase